MAFTVLEYVYRDTQNFTRHAEWTLDGVITPEQEDAVYAHCLALPRGTADRRAFYPGQVGIPDPYKEMDGAYDDDPWWSEILRFTVHGGTSTIAYQPVGDFVARFTTTEWDEDAARQTVAEIAANR